MSQYNDEDRCATCSRTSRSALTTIRRVPDEVWRDAAVQSALTSWDFGRASRLIRELAGLRQDDMAGLTGLSQGFLSMLESGARRLTNIDKVTRFLQGAGAPTELLPPFSQEQASSSPALSAPTGLAGAIGGAAGVHPNVTDLRSLAAQAAAQSLQFAELVAPSNVTDDVMEGLTFELARIATGYVHAPLQSLFDDLLSTRDRLFALLGGRQHPRQTRELFVLAGTSCLLLAHASQNLGDERSAMAQIRTAWTCAEQADHTGLQAWAKGTAALIAEWSAHQHLALRHTTQAAPFAPAGESRIRIAAIEARAAARMGDRVRAVGALAALQQAREQQAAPGGLMDFGGLLTFPEAKQEYYIGGTYALLGEHTQAERHATRAISLYELGTKEDRSYGDEALARLDIVTARLATGEVEAAGEQFEEILQLPENLRIRQIGSAVQKVGTLLQQPRLAGNRTARALADAARSYQTLDITPKVPMQ
ncbi:helix-turn-helix domain-containing protein [Streptomyces sp. H10-C2]|uniref:helix-turn-helix domain-containing protein n=1 Tax=unclassified Streptomyces TaxID=2593676 RepID=UPI0024B926DC|nr:MULTISPECIES: helix-turn-helix domain-containing protein [unclassified Streptomyces]MDJ0346835.1 helix-turn-helix domain-containing protein [Streptomyces sp. PH10-H1]MDJ0375735.1 helix-turn-helix domain-containing protein [Streptomyces sp. H10-C2]